MIELHHGDCLEVMGTLPANSVDLIVTDPPYFRVKGLDWDRQWKTPAAFLEWMGRLCDEWHRLLKPNGSLYVFASPKMAARVECKIGERFEVLNSIVWSKADEPTHALKYGDDRFRQFIQKSERIIFAEHFGSDNHAKGEAGYAAKCDEVRGFVFEPIRAYLDGERKRAGVAHRAVIAHLGMTGHDSHFFSPVQWKLPLPGQYEAMRQLFGSRGGDYLRRDYDYLRREYEDLRREYEDLRTQYEDLRRPFSVDASVPYTDVWDFPTVSARPGKHPCQKPYDLIAHIIRASSRPGDVVLDCFAGSGVTGDACQTLGRSCILIEKDPAWCRRLASAATPLIA